MYSGLSGSRRNNQRRFPKILGRRPDKKAQRQAAAAVRQTAYSLLTREEKIALLDAGGFRAKKQRNKFGNTL